ncbi:MULTISPECIES: aminoglycoside phosphotransferase family protein [Streptomyces]|uniref:Hydroxyurea phosphotransferase n=1 Tax=Streptomyces virginiae TaxID=1961 RepID=A0ABQ3NVD1_STRVG|nr:MULTISPECIES: aminoglycoside phosphotransferase family protein [Streptomyces]GLV90329.1 hydroxyurea phosphotransferase [Streptomyces lavendulae subsp. lavendulae]MBP2344904.1 streptomycin 6-kinase [Streptomyces virginiae]MCI4082290.1 aminoglycoside phosphotransferase family protein [Streptomyces sp. MMS21 TC-5]QNE26687.1 phosphotransferase [Streptomyces sp. INR7]RST11342.1 hydroxyurea phosphotransferase [Streptomyces sp. WAC05950]
MVDITEIPDGLVEAQVGFNGDAGREFIAALPGLAAEFLQRWRLRRCGPVMHGVTALVVPVERADGSAAALKLVSLDDECVGEPVALRAWDGDGSVRLLEHDADTGTLLLERLDGEQDLAELARRDARQAVRVVGELLARLTAVPAPAGLRGLGDMAAGMLADVPQAVGRLVDERDRRLLRDCAAAVAEVAGEPGDRLLHWDLHYGNVLAGGREAWLAIDPKPLAGDPGFDLMPAIVNNFRVEDVRWRFDLLAEAVGADRGRARAWTLGRVLQNCLWDVEDGEERLDGEQSAVAEALLRLRA